MSRCASSSTGKTGNTSAIPAPALLDTSSSSRTSCKENYGHDDAVPDRRSRAPSTSSSRRSSDYLLEPDTLMGNAAVLHAAGASWTIGTGYFDGINYGLFYSDRMLDRIVSKEVAEVRRLDGQARS